MSGECASISGGALESYFDIAWLKLTRTESSPLAPPPAPAPATPAALIAPMVVAEVRAEEGAEAGGGVAAQSSSMRIWENAWLWRACSVASRQSQLTCVHVNDAPPCALATSKSAAGKDNHKLLLPLQCVKHLGNK